LPGSSPPQDISEEAAALTCGSPEIAMLNSRLTDDTRNAIVHATWVGSPVRNPWERAIPKHLADGIAPSFDTSKFKNRKKCR
jgi:hypothetical protein